MGKRSLRRRTALRLGCSLFAVGLAGCNEDSTDPTGEATNPQRTPTSTATDGTVERTDATGSPTEETDAAETTATEPTAPIPETVSARRVAGGFTSPLGLEIPQPGRRFVVDQAGQVYLQDDQGVHREPYLDVTDRMVDVNGSSEQGLLGLAFHPDFDENGRLFVRYSAPPREGTPDGYAHTFVLSEFEADPGATRADPDSERTILEIPQPRGNHNAGAITFGPDGYLYVAVGDGGGANDTGSGHVDDWYGAVGGGNGQDLTENLLGSILRIDVDGEANGKPYAVPSDNPLVGSDGLDEQYAWGFRNPWRLSFGPGGRLFVGDVGQGAWEEVSIVEKGGNYGWNVKEGSHCFDADSCPDESPRGRQLRDPVVEYPHSGDGVAGISVIGGYLYDGADVPGLAGRYVFADWQAGGELFVATEQSEGLWPTRAVPVDSEAGFGPNVLSFGRNPAGELFVCTTAEGGVTGDTGAVFKLGAGG
ncbi:sugar dehydrogenase [Halobacteriales archaeon QH_10_67_22]|nr:MAG: sugar dehydrogenase [Halobacteriales archaeon QH_10_67_22]